MAFIAGTSQGCRLGEVPGSPGQFTNGGHIMPCATGLVFNLAICGCVPGQISPGNNVCFLSTNRTRNACGIGVMLVVIDIHIIIVIYTIIFLKSVCLSEFANCRSQFLLDRLGRCI